MLIVRGHKFQVTTYHSWENNLVFQKLARNRISDGWRMRKEEKKLRNKALKFRKYYLNFDVTVFKRQF